MPTQPSKKLETFDNPFPDRDYLIEITSPEFTCLCPKTGQPDFAEMHLEYVPDRLCVELKSLKLYYWSFRNEGAFHEAVTNTILDDLVAATHPRYMCLRAHFYVRGGIYTTVEAEYRQPGWQPPPPPPEHLPRETRELPPREREVHAAREEGGGRLRQLRRETAGGAGTGPAAEERVEAAPPPPAPIYVGIDLGTTGCRVAAIDDDGQLLAQAEAPIPAPMQRETQVTQDPEQWWKAVSSALSQLFLAVDPQRVRSLAVDGTSSTVLLCDAAGHPVTPGLMYNDSRAQEQAEAIGRVADRNSGAHGAGSSLAKMLWLQQKDLHKKARHLLHQADWITGRLSGAWGQSDYNNCLKLGYDATGPGWPDWFGALGVHTGLLPEVHAPGEALATVSAETAAALGLSPDTRVLAGTTDGVAAFLAAGAETPGQGVSSLGSTLVLKLLSAAPVFSPPHGVYSHKLGAHWLAGGASNSGGAVLLQYFKVEQMEEMTLMLDPEHPTGLDYYPLPAVGERFPVNDPEMIARLEPLPGDSVAFFQAMLEGIANIEARGYALLAELGAPRLTEVRTTGAGARNPAWTRIREKRLGVPVVKARSELTAYGAALLAAGIVARRFA